MKVTRAAIEALGATWNDAAIQDRRRTQASEIAELRKDLETARGELARQRTRADIAERRAERAESELEGMRWSMRVMQGQDPSSDVREIDEPHVATAPSGEALPILDRDEGKK
jgi:septal ring factor EnvC (AmiA/AmiB activator)